MCKLILFNLSAFYFYFCLHYVFAFLSNHFVFCFLKSALILMRDDEEATNWEDNYGAILIQTHRRIHVDWCKTHTSTFPKIFQKVFVHAVVIFSLRDSIVTIRADFQRACCWCPNMNTVNDNYKLTCSNNGNNLIISCGYIIFSHWANLKPALQFHALLIVTIFSL